MKRSHDSLDRRAFVKGAGASIAAGLMAAGATSALAEEAAEESAAEQPAAPSASGEPMTAEAFNNLTWSFEVPPEPVSNDQITQTITDDVIVIGLGLSPASLTAASILGHGGSCTLFSAGTKAVSRGGSNHAVGSKTQERLGIDYTPEVGCRLLQQRDLPPGLSHGLAQVVALHQRVGRGHGLGDRHHGAGRLHHYARVALRGSRTARSPSPRGAHNFYGPEITNSANEGEPLLTATLEKYILDNGGTITYSTKAEYLIREDDKTGRVTGVVATDADGNYVKYEGTKGIVLATGDFSGDPDMMAKYCNAFADYVSELAGDYDVEFQFGGLMPGDGQKMGLWVGAAWQNTTPSAPMIGWYGFPGAALSTRTTPASCSTSRASASSTRPLAVYAGYAVKRSRPTTRPSPCGTPTLRIASNTWEALGNNMDGLGIVPVSAEEKAAEFEAGVEGGTYVKGDTIEDVLNQLAEQGGIDVEAARATIDAYNADVAAGQDTQFHKCAEHLIPIENGPFYGQYNQLGQAQFLCVLGGLRTSPKCEVCDANNKPIEGLYNVGCMMGDFFGTFYNFRVPGESIGATCITFPYLLGKELAEAE